jgi:hypothetical protein
MTAIETPARSARLLVCRPSFGQGNRLNALLACLAVAMATDRALLVDWGGQAADAADGAGAGGAGGDLEDLVRLPDLVGPAAGAEFVGRVLESAAAANELQTGAQKCGPCRALRTRRPGPPLARRRGPAQVTAISAAFVASPSPPNPPSPDPAT